VYQIFSTKLSIEDNNNNKANTIFIKGESMLNLKGDDLATPQLTYLYVIGFEERQ
jgi:hypothetical protein